MRKDRTGKLFLGYLLLYIAFATFLISYFSSQESQGYRIGATCSDGWSSSATGSGACSHHGGVARWRYSMEDGSDPSNGYNAAMGMAVIGGVIVLYAKSIEISQAPATPAKSNLYSTPSPIVKDLATKNRQQIRTASQSPPSEIPVSFTRPQQCACGAWMFKSTNTNNVEVFRCSRVAECGKTKPYAQPEI